MTVDDALAGLTRGCVDVVTPEGLRAKLARGRPLTVKVGFDPTAPDIHLGHTVLMRKMKNFQNLGHRVIFVIGDFTGMIGDPTGKSRTRPPLSRAEIAANAETYKAQAFKILDPVKTELRFNSEWLGTLGSEGLVRLAAKYNVARMLERRDFRERLQQGRAISIHEFLYPLAQAYDSVALEADVELGGTDQLFNLNVGRDIMPGYGLEPQVVMTTPLLEGLDGVEKMSKSLGNYVGVTEPAEVMYAKLMSISDELMWKYYSMLTDLSAAEIEAERGTGAPMASKMALCRRIVADFHGEAAAASAEAEWRRVHQEHQPPTVLEERRHEGVFKPHQLLLDLGLVASSSEGVRLVRQGAVRINNQVVRPSHQIRIPLRGDITVSDGTQVDVSGRDIVVSIGARRHVKVRPKE